MRPLNSCPMHPGLHLYILQIRRAGTRLREVIRLTGIRIDIIWALASIRPVLEFQHREEASDDGKTGADKSDRAFNVRPEGCCVDCICWVCFGGPKENDEAVDRGEADEYAEGEDAVQGQFVLPGAVEIPDHWNWEDEDYDVHQNVEGLVDDEKCRFVETGSRDAAVPVGAERAALSGAGEEDY